MAATKSKKATDEMLEDMNQFDKACLGSMFRAEMRKSKDRRDWSEAQFDYAYPTGYLSFDFMNGCKVDVRMKDGTEFTYNSIGIVDGTMISMVGRAGCGKSTFAMQALGEIIRPFPRALFIHEDIEGGMSSMRKRQLLKMSEEEFKNKYVCRNTGITTENFLSRIFKIHDIKLENYADYEYDTGLYDPDGNRIFKLEPTVILLDSWAMLMPDEMAETDEISSNMTINSGTKSNTNLIKKIIPKLKAANIILCVINHLLPDPSIMPKKTQTAWLKKGERCPGGETAIYLANNFLRFDDGTKLRDDKDFGINGIHVAIQFVKSRTNESGLSIPMVLNYEIGFDKELSALMLLKEKERIESRGAYYWLDQYPDLKFTQKGFKEKLETNEEFAQAFMIVYMQELEKLISTTSVKSRQKIKDEEESGESEKVVKLDFTSMMMQQMRANIPA